MINKCKTFKKMYHGLRKSEQLKSSLIGFRKVERETRKTYIWVLRKK